MAGKDRTVITVIASYRVVGSKDGVPVSKFAYSLAEGLQWIDAQDATGTFRVEELSARERRRMQRVSESL